MERVDNEKNNSHRLSAKPKYKIEAFIVPPSNGRERRTRSVEESKIDCRSEEVEPNCDDDSEIITVETKFEGSTIEKRDRLARNARVSAALEMSVEIRPSNAKDSRENTKSVAGDRSELGDETNVHDKLDSEEPTLKLRDSVKPSVDSKPVQVPEENVVGSANSRGDPGTIERSENASKAPFNVIDTISEKTKRLVDTLSEYTSPLPSPPLNMIHRRKSKSYDTLARLPKPAPTRTGSLKSIDERNESLCENFEEFCHHGHRNGCTVTAQSPEAVSREVFEENWMGRLESLRRRETLSRDKEAILRERERLLSEKEKELGILERLAKEKIRKAELYLELWSRNLRNTDRRTLERERSPEPRCFESFEDDAKLESFKSASDENLESRPYRVSRETTIARVRPVAIRVSERESSEDIVYSQRLKSFRHGSTESTSIRKARSRNVESRIPSRAEEESKVPWRDGNNEKYLSGNDDSKRPVARESRRSVERVERNKDSRRESKYVRGRSSASWNDIERAESELGRFASNSKNSVATEPAVHLEIVSRPGAAGSNVESRPSRFGTRGSCKLKPRPKVSYDDLDSTLSADIGDASFVVTSKKLDMNVFRKSYVLARSMSERRAKSAGNGKTAAHAHPLRNVASNGETLQIAPNDKIFKRLSENVSVARRESTKFQNYGLVDTVAMVRREAAPHACQGIGGCNGNAAIIDKRYSYLDLEAGKNTVESKERAVEGARDAKERPTSWSEEANAWLRKKRRAYNSTVAKKIPTEDFENIKHNKRDEKSHKSEKRPEIKNVERKRFAIFR